MAGCWGPRDAEGNNDGKYDERYASNIPLAFAFACIYSLGVPALFIWLVYRFKADGQAGNRVIQGALGWPVLILQNTFSHERTALRMDWVLTPEHCFCTSMTGCMNRFATERISGSA